MRQVVSHRREVDVAGELYDREDREHEQRELQDRLPGDSPQLDELRRLCPDGGGCFRAQLVDVDLGVL
jgi:hypothetical protein